MLTTAFAFGNKQAAATGMMPRAMQAFRPAPRVRPPAIRVQPQSPVSRWVDAKVVGAPATSARPAAAAPAVSAAPWTLGRTMMYAGLGGAAYGMMRDSDVGKPVSSALTGATFAMAPAMLGHLAYRTPGTMRWLRGMKNPW